MAGHAIAEPIVFTGGVALSGGRALAEVLGRPVQVAPGAAMHLRLEPRLVAADRLGGLPPAHT